MKSKIYVISLKSAEARRRDLLAACPAELRSRIEFFPATDGRDPAALAPWKSRVSRVRTFFTLKNHYLSDTEIAVFASHFSLWKLCAARGEPMVICEDDIAFCEDFVRKVEALEASSLSCVRFFVATSSKLTRVSEHFSVFRRSGNCWFAAGYWLTPEAARGFLAAAGTWGEEVDALMDKYWRTGVPVVVSVPYWISLNENSKMTQIFGRVSRRGCLLRVCIFSILRELRRVRAFFAWKKMERGVLRGIAEAEEKL